MSTLSAEEIHEEVRQRYGKIADEFKLEVQGASCCGPGAEEECCSSSELYDIDISSLPSDVTGLSLGCGDPISLAALQPGQTVLDLGAGGGIDCFLAARQVGATGHVIGVDMTESMLAKANRNKEKLGLDNVEFRHGKIEKLPVDAETIDVAISNCVINLSPDKPAVFREVFRVLKPGGKMAVSDIVTQGRFSDEERADMAAWTGCITGAEDVADYVAAIRAAGFHQVSVQEKGSPDKELADSPRSDDPPRWFSARITATKPLDASG
jgi:arsenite methyltransferase